MTELQFACDLLHQFLLSICELHTKILKVLSRKVSHPFLLSPVTSQLELFLCWAFGKSLLRQSHWAGCFCPRHHHFLMVLTAEGGGEGAREIPPVLSPFLGIYSAYFHEGPLNARHSKRWGTIVSNVVCILVGGNRY